MDLKRLKIKKLIEQVIEEKCSVKTKYKGEINLEDVTALVSIPAQHFDIYAQSDPKIYKTEMDIKISVLGHDYGEIETIAEFINQYVLMCLDAIDLRNIRTFENFEGQRKVSGLELSYEFKTYVRQEG